MPVHGTRFMDATSLSVSPRAVAGMTLYVTFVPFAGSLKRYLGYPYIAGSEFVPVYCTWFVYIGGALRWCPCVMYGFVSVYADVATGLYIYRAADYSDGWTFVVYGRFSLSSYRAVCWAFVDIVTRDIAFPIPLQ